MAQSELTFSNAANASAATGLVRDQRDLPLPRPIVRGSAVSIGRRARRRLDAHRRRSGDLRALDNAVADLGQGGRSNAPIVDRPRRASRS